MQPLHPPDPIDGNVNYRPPRPDDAQRQQQHHQGAPVLQHHIQMPYTPPMAPLHYQPPTSARNLLLSAAMQLHSQQHWLQQDSRGQRVLNDAMQQLQQLQQIYTQNETQRQMQQLQQPIMMLDPFSMQPQVQQPMQQAQTPAQLAASRNQQMVQQWLQQQRDVQPVQQPDPQPAVGPRVARAEGHADAAAATDSGSLRDEIPGARFTTAPSSGRLADSSSDLRLAPLAAAEDAAAAAAAASEAIAAAPAAGPSQPAPRKRGRPPAETKGSDSSAQHQMARRPRLSRSLIFSFPGNNGNVHVDLQSVVADFDDDSESVEKSIRQFSRLVLRKVYEDPNASLSVTVGCSKSKREYAILPVECVETLARFWTSHTSIATTPNLADIVEEMTTCMRSFLIQKRSLEKRK